MDFKFFCLYCFCDFKNLFLFNFLFRVILLVRIMIENGCRGRFLMVVFSGKIESLFLCFLRIFRFFRSCIVLDELNFIRIFVILVI